MSADSCETIPVRIVLLGDSGIGAKTSLLQRYLNGPLTDWPKSTRTPHFVERTVVVDDVTLKLHIWDTGGQEQFGSLLPKYYEKAHIAIIGFDVTKRITFEACDGWIQLIRDRGEVMIFAVGNKIDLVGRRQVTTEEAREHFSAMKPPIPYFETSALNGEGVNILFEGVLKMWMIRRSQNRITEEGGESPKLSSDKQESKGWFSFLWWSNPDEGKNIVFSSRRGVGLAREGDRNTRTSTNAEEFLCRIYALSRIGEMNDDDYDYFMKFCERCITSAIKSSDFLFPNETEKDNIVVAADVFSTLVDVLNHEPLFVKVDGFAGFVKRLYDALTTADSLLAAEERVIHFARRFVWRLLDMKASGLMAIEGSEELKNLSLKLLDRNNVLDVKKGSSSDTLNPAVILSERGRESGLKVKKAYVFKSVYNTYLAADVNWSVEIDKQPPKFSINYAWTAEPVPDKLGVVVIKSMLYGTYLSSTFDGSVGCVRRAVPTDTEYWWPDRDDNGFVYLKNKNHCFLSINPDPVVHVANKRVEEDDFAVNWFAVPLPREGFAMGDHEWASINVLDTVWCDACGDYISKGKACKCRKCGICCHETCKCLIRNPCMAMIDSDQKQPSQKTAEEEEAAKKAAREKAARKAAEEKKAFEAEISGWKKFVVPDDASPDEKQRLNVANEIITTEIEFADSMSFLVDGYARPLKDNPHGLSQEEYMKLFNDIDPILLVSRELIKLLVVRGDHGIGSSFLMMSEYLKGYKAFCARHQTRIELLNAIVSRNSDFKKFIAEVKLLPESKHRDLESFLMHPVQRICKYPLLLRELRKATVNEKELKELDLVMTKIQSVVDVINSSTREIENQLSIQELSQKFTNYATYAADHGDFVTPTRRLVKEGVISKYSSYSVSSAKDEGKEEVATSGSFDSKLMLPPRSISSHVLFSRTYKLFLFNDVLLLVREGARKKLTILEWFSLGDILLDVDSDGVSSGVRQNFLILRPEDSKVFVMNDGANIGWLDILSRTVPKRGEIESKPFYLKDITSIKSMQYGDCMIAYDVVDRTRFTLIAKNKSGIVNSTVLRFRGGYICPSMRCLRDFEDHPIIFGSLEEMYETLRKAFV